MRDNGMMQKAILLMLSAITGLVGWTLFTVHTIAVNVAALERSVIDGKEVRIEFQRTTAASFDAIKLEIACMKDRLTVIEQKLKVIP